MKSLNEHTDVLTNDSCVRISPSQRGVYELHSSRVREDRCLLLVLYKQNIALVGVDIRLKHHKTTIAHEAVTAGFNTEEDDVTTPDSGDTARVCIDNVR